MIKTVFLHMALLSAILAAGSGYVFAQSKVIQETSSGNRTPAVRTNQTGGTDMEDKLHLAINDTEVSVVWEDNASVDALKELVADGPVSIDMSMYGGFEQVGPIGTSLVSQDVQTETQPGDIVLYAGSNIVIFYGSNSWAYTKLGRITDQTEEEMTGLLGNGDVTIALSD